jgi:hypothetical protein
MYSAESLQVYRLGLSRISGPQMTNGTVGSNNSAARFLEAEFFRLNYALQQSVGQGAQLQPYRSGGGHHVPAKIAFTGASGYNPGAAPAIPKSELARLNIKHSSVTGAQSRLYTSFAKSGQPLTWGSMAQIETQALVSAGMHPATAASTVRAAINSLRLSGVAGPTHLPRGK